MGDTGKRERGGVWGRDRGGEREEGRKGESPAQDVVDPVLLLQPSVTTTRLHPPPKLAADGARPPRPPSGCEARRDMGARGWGGRRGAEDGEGGAQWYDSEDAHHAHQ